MSKRTKKRQKRAALLDPRRLRSATARPLDEFRVEDEPPPEDPFGDGTAGVRELRPRVLR